MVLWCALRFCVELKFYKGLCFVDRICLLVGVRCMGILLGFLSRFYEASVRL